MNYQKYQHFEMYLYTEIFTQKAKLQGYYDRFTNHLKLNNNTFI